MAFTPKSEIRLCKVDFDNTYEHQVIFGTQTEQFSYFNNRTQKTFTEYLTVRGHSPDSHIIQVGSNIDDLQILGINYMVYRNENSSSKWFYAFITKMEYVNEDVTALYFEQDVFQTWFFDVDILPSFVEREHSLTDYIGENVVPESFNFQDFVYELAYDYEDLDEWGYLVGSTECLEEDTAIHYVQSGIYQGVYFYYFKSGDDVDNFISTVTQESGGDCILFVCAIPDFSIYNHSDTGLCTLSVKPNKETITIPFNKDMAQQNWNTVINNKLFTAPFFQLYITNQSGKSCNYNVEDFDSDADPKYYDGINKPLRFFLTADISASPSVSVFPLDYKNIPENFEEGVSLGQFPQCAYSTDTFKLWLAKNQYSLGMQGVSSGIGAIAGVLTLDGQAISSSIQNAINTANSVYQASMTPNQGQTGNASNNLLTALGLNKFMFYWKKIKPQYQKIVDDFFTMYGYQTNQVKMPNLRSRPFFNYVKTININVVGGIPSDHLTRFKAIFNNGVTLWKSTAQIGEYRTEYQDNRPLQT